MRFILLFITVLSLTGCAIQPNKHGKISYKGHDIASEKHIASLEREAKLDRLITDCKIVGYDLIHVSLLVDPVSDTIMNLFKNQCRLMNQYRVMLDNHRDVTSFLIANQGKTEQQINEEVARFDSLAATESERIGPKMKAYQQASDRVWRENVKLGGHIAKNSVILAALFHDNFEELLGQESIKTLLSGKRLFDAYDLAEIRLHIAKLANDFIEDEKAIIAISKELQREQNERN